MMHQMHTWDDREVVAACPCCGGEIRKGDGAVKIGQDMLHPECLARDAVRILYKMRIAKDVTA